MSNNFEMNYLGNASYVLGIQISRYHSKDILGLSQKGYIEKPLQRYNMQDCKPLDTPISKEDKLSLSQCQKNVLEVPEMEKFLYAQVVMSLMYIQFSSRPVIAYIVGVLGRYMSNQGMAHWKAAKWVLRYLQRTKNNKLMYRKSERLEIIRYSDFLWIHW